MIKPNLIQRCLSTHGASGYAPGSYKDGSAVICGLCGERIENPRPLYHQAVFFTFREAILSWSTMQKWLRGEPKELIPQWPK